MNAPRAAIGFRVRTGRATAVLLGGTPQHPELLARRALGLTDPAVPDSKQPYHAALDVPEARGRELVRRASEAVHAVALREVRALVDELRARKVRACGAGLVVGSDGDPDRIKNAHVRAHALEGRLFREALEAGAAACRVPCLLLVEREAFASAEVALGRPSDELKRTVEALGEAVGRPWRAEEKLAALAGWCALAAHFERRA